MGSRSIFRRFFPYAKVLVGIHILQKYGLGICVTEGPSMIPTIGPGRDLLLYEKLSVSISRLLGTFGRTLIRRNDVIIANSVDNPEIAVCKRVIAKEGDIVTIYPSHTLVTINNGEFRSFPSRHPIHYQGVVPPNYYWIQGDNSKNSRDSRNYGPIHESMIIGRVVCKIWPNPIFSVLTSTFRREGKELNSPGNLKPKSE
ncbi:mitochondrial inner membrane protease subunit 1-like [Cryptosporidium felis]|nr:mitochondrial inner membrane protease subunit 1-like [Cryptosporidium felis]